MVFFLLRFLTKITPRQKSRKLSTDGQRGEISPQQHIPAAKMIFPRCPEWTAHQIICCGRGGISPLFSSVESLRDFLPAYSFRHKTQ